VVKEGDYLTTIIQSQGLADTQNALIIIFMLNPSIDPTTGNITVGQTILLPPPNYPLPTSTPIPTGLAPGARITYRILPGDSLNGIAAQFHSTVPDILLLNKALLPNGEASIIYPGQLLVVRINLVTPVPTANPTASSTP
jgi:LysM repeat protein